MKVKKSNIWMSISGILLVLLILSSLKGGNMGTGVSITQTQAGAKVKEFFETYQDIDIGIVSVKEVSGMYEVTTSYSGQERNFYLSKDGDFIGSMTNLALLEEQPEEETEEESPEVTKSDKPEVELFIMSYCPYGTQVEKAVLPVMELLGNKADISVNFVDYIMHGQKEIDENLNQYCIQKEQSDKFTDYAYCFLKEGKTEECMTEANIDKEKLNSCIEATDKEFKITELYEDESTWSGGRYPQFNVHSDLNDKYGVRGSPTVVINGQVVSVSRSPDAIKQAVCNAFNKAPEECETKLSTNQASPGFGFSETTSTTGGQCG